MKRNRILALTLAVLLLACCLTACSSAAKTSASYAEMPAAAALTEETAGTAADTVNTFVATDNAAASEASKTASASGTSAAEGQTADTAPTAESMSKKLIYTANVTLQTTEFDKAVAALEASVDSIGGFVENSSVNGNTVYRDDGTTTVVDRVAYYTVRVPADRFKEYLSQVDGLGNVISSSKSAENVTSSYTDYEAQLDSLKTQEKRLLELLAKAEDVDSLVALEERLSDVRYQIDSIERSLRDLDAQIAYSTVSVELDEVEAYTPTATVTRTFGQKLSDALSDGWNSFVRGMQGFCVGIVSVLPTLVLLALIALAIVLIVRSSRKKRREKAQKNAAQQPPQAPQPPQA